MRPEKESKAFAKVALEPGETQSVTLTLGERALSFYDDAQARWVAEAGEFKVLVGSSSRNLRCAGMFTLCVRRRIKRLYEEANWDTVQIVIVPPGENRLVLFESLEITNEIRALQPGNSVRFWMVQSTMRSLEW